MKLKYIIATLLGCVFSLSVMAQVTTDTEQVPVSEELPKQALVEILTAPHQIISLPEQAIEIDMSLLNIPSGAKDLAEGVTAKGYARSVEVEGQKIGQVVLIGVTKGDKSEPLDSQTFSAQFEMKDENLKPDQPITIMGDGQQLIEALKRLQEEPAPEEPEEQEEVSQPGNPDSTSAGDGGNPDAAAYQSPDPVEKAPDPVETVSMTTQGCSIRVDFSQMKAFVQSKVQNFTDGTLKSEGECSDSEVSFPLQKSYSVCSDKVDLNAKNAIAQFKFFYNDDGNNRHDVGECQPDMDQTFKIAEKYGTCPMVFDYNAQKATFQAQLAYKDSNNVEHIVQGCTPSEEKASVPLVRTTQGCSIRHDFAARKSFRQAIWTYQTNGNQYNAGNCIDDGMEYSHINALKDDNGQYICQPIQHADGTFTLQRRTKIVVDGQNQYLSECTPDSGDTLVKTMSYEGCSNREDLNQLVAIRQGKELVFENGKLISEGSCKDTDTRYPIERVYSGCEDATDPTNGTANAQFKYSYQDITGEKKVIGECQPDTDRTFNIVEKFDACPMVFDLASQEAIPQSQLVYTNHNNVETVVQDCAPSKSKTAVPLVRKTQSCSIRHDFVLGKSFRQSVWTYKVDGVQYQAGDCEDDGTEYPHVKKYRDAANQYICTPVKGELAGYFTLQSRVQITVDGQAQFLTECTPDDVSLFVETVYEGCKVREDLTQMVAVRQGRKMYYENGDLVDEGECEDTDIRFPIEKGYAACNDLVDLENKKATAQFKHFYVNIDGENIPIGECQPDEEKTYDIVEKHDSCTTFMDYDKKEAVFQSKLVYMNQNSQEQQVRACEASEEKPAVPLTLTTQGCTIRHDFAAGKSLRQSVYTYQDNNVTYQAGDCLDDGTEYAHTVVYKDDVGQYFCAPINNGSTITLQSRKKINVDGLSTFISECTPDTTTQIIKSTMDGCTNPANWTHDIAAGQSYGQERFYFEDKGKRVYLGACQDSAATYTHQVETVDWEDHDDQLYAYPKTTVYINTPFTGRYNIKTGEVLLGAQQMPYEFDRFDIAAGGNPTYEGCNKVQPYNNVKVWLRPNKTVYFEILGESEPATENACQTVGAETVGDWALVDDGTLQRFAEAHQTCISSPETECRVSSIESGTNRECTYTSERKTVRADGDVINTVPLEMKLPRSNYSNVTGASGVNGYCGSGKWPNSLNWSCALSLGWVVPDIQCEAHPTPDEVAAKLAE